MVVFALAGIQWRKPMEGMNVYFLLDRSESVPSLQQEAARKYVNRVSAEKEEDDEGGVIVFGADTGIEHEVNPIVDLHEIQSVVSTHGTDLAGAIRLATAAFPETGQR
jgi:hypothetical protein